MPLNKVQEFHTKHSIKKYFYKKKSNFATEYRIMEQTFFTNITLEQYE